MYDAAASIAIGVLLIAVAVAVGWHAKDLLLGESAGPEVREAIEAAALQHPAVEAVSALLTMHLAPDDLLVAANIEVVSPKAFSGHLDGMTTTEETHHDRRSIRELIDQLSEDVRGLVRAEVSVIRAELEEKVRRLAVGAALVAVAGVLGLVALGAATATAIIALANVLATWLAALIVTAVFAFVAGIVLLAGVKMLRRGVPPAPKESVDSIKEDVSWVKARARSGAT